MILFFARASIAALYLLIHVPGPTFPGVTLSLKSRIQIAARTKTGTDPKSILRQAMKAATASGTSGLGFPPAKFAPQNSLIHGLDRANPEAAEGVTPAQYKEAAKLIRAFGFDCPQADLINRFFFSAGFYVWCLGGHYEFEIQDHGGKWTVKSDD